MEDYIDDLYLLFLDGGYYFLLPLRCVRQVRERKQDTIEEFNFSRRLHKKGLAEKYHVLVESDGKEFCLAAEEVLGIEELDKYSFAQLESPVLNQRNRYLKAAIKNWTDRYDFAAAFLLEPSFLYREMVKENEMADS